MSNISAERLTTLLEHASVAAAFPPDEARDLIIEVQNLQAALAEATATQQASRHALQVRDHASADRVANLIANLRSVVRLCEPDDLTPGGARQITAVLDRHDPDLEHGDPDLQPFDDEDDPHVVRGL